MAMLNQILCTFIACFLCLCLGMGFAWPGSTMQIFQSENTTLSRPMTEMELALFSGLSSVGALIGTPVIGIFLDVIGRKYCAMSASLMSVIAWTIIAVSNQVEAILAAVFITGIGGAGVLVVPVLVGEICQESIRGAMTSCAMIFYGVGMLMTYIIGGFLSYKITVYICLSLTVCGILLLMFLKESPTYLFKRGYEDNARRSMAFYRNANENSKEVVHEMNTLRRAFKPELEDETPAPAPASAAQVDGVQLRKQKEAESQNKQKISFLQFFKKSRSTQRACFVTLMLTTASIFQGLVAVQMNAEGFFKEILPTIPAANFTVLFAVICILAGCVAGYMTDRVGRRPLMVYSSAGAGVCCLLLGASLHAGAGPGWLRAALVYLFAALYTFGAGTIPFVLVAEVFLPEIKSLISMLIVEWTWMCNFILLFTYQPLVACLGRGPVFYIFATICFITTVFCIAFQPETKGLAVDEIQEKFVKRKNKNEIVTQC